MKVRAPRSRQKVEFAVLPYVDRRQEVLFGRELRKASITLTRAFLVNYLATMSRSTIRWCLALALRFGLANADCSIVSEGTSGDVLYRGTVLTVDGPLQNGYVLVRSGKIEKVGQGKYGCATVGDYYTVVECPGSVISPGWINAHEHLSYSTVNPLPNGGELYDHRQEWRVGEGNHTELEANINGSSSDAVKWGELRHLFSGTTSVAGGSMATGLTRNLDFAAGLEGGLILPVDTLAVFPLDDSDGTTRLGDCDYGSGAINRSVSLKYYRYIGHVAEGIDDVAHNEFACLSSMDFDTTPLPDGGGTSSDIMAANTVLIHALGLNETDFDLVAERNAAIVWSPRSNIFLYGKTLNVTYLLEAGITVALGTDWLPSGSATMAREAVCAESATRTSYDRVLAPKTLWEMMTINAAKAVGFDHSLGSIERGKLADIVIFAEDAAASDDPYAQAVYAAGEYIELVMRGGEVLLASKDLESLATSPCESVSVGDAERVICVQQELNQTFAAFSAALDGVYPAILPGTPPDEPSCVPVR